MTYSMSPLGGEAVERVEAQGFRLPEPMNAGDQPKLPEDLSDLDDEMLMNEYALFTAWADYANAQVGLAIIAEREAERHLEYLTGLFWSDQPRTKPVTTIKAEAAQEPGIVDATEALDRATAYRRVVSSLAAFYERDAAVLSRELSRRIQPDRMSKRERYTT